jgi:hypothetical protein
MVVIGSERYLRVEETAVSSPFRRRSIGVSRAWSGAD